jgi:hypothetical protein
MDEKYLVDGRSVTVIATLPDGRFLVDPLYEYDDEDYPADAPFITDHIFDAAPTNKLNQDVERLNREIEQLRKTRNAISLEIEAAKRENEATLKEYAKFSELKQLNDFIAGKITHYLVIPGYSEPHILKFGDTKEEDYRLKAFKMLTLYGTTEGSLVWNLNQYRDGSGSYTRVIPCTSYEQVLEEAQKYLDSETYKEWSSSGLIKFAQEYNLRLPDGYIERAKQQKRESAQKRIQEAQAQLDKANAELEAL